MFYCTLSIGYTFQLDTVTDNALSITGRNGTKVFWFNGRKDSLVKENEVSTTEGCISGWIYCSSQSLNKPGMSIIFETATVNAGEASNQALTWGIALYIKDKKLFLGFKNEKAVGQYIALNNLTEVYLADQWVYLTVTWENGIITAYLNGIKKSSMSYNQDNKLLLTDRILIGNGSIANVGFKGGISQLSYVNTVLKDDEIKKLYDSSLSPSQDDFIVDFDSIKLQRGSTEDNQNKISLLDHDFLSIKNPYRNIFHQGFYIKFSLPDPESSNSVKNILNAADGEPETGGNWGYALNYSKTDGFTFLLNTDTGFKKVLTNYKAEPGAVYSVFAYWDSEYVYLFINDSSFVQYLDYAEINTDSDHILIGAGVVNNSYIAVDLYNFILVPEYLKTKEDIKKYYTHLRHPAPPPLLDNPNVGRDKPVMKIKPKTFLYAGMGAFSVAALSLTALPILFYMQDYTMYYYYSYYGLYKDASLQKESDIYYDEMKTYANIANACLISGIVTIPLFLISFSSGILFTYLYHVYSMKYPITSTLQYTPDGTLQIALSLRM